jgi:hypothetical protein
LLWRINPHISYRFCCGMRTPNGCCVDLEVLLGQYETYSRGLNPSPSLTRSLPLVSPFQVCLLKPGQSPPRSHDRRWCLHQDLRRLATNQYEICGLSRFLASIVHAALTSTINLNCREATSDATLLLAVLVEYEYRF